MSNQHRYVASAQRRFYSKNWLEFCDLIRVEPQKIGAFNKQGDLIGLQLPVDFDYTTATKSLRLMYAVKEEGVDMRCYLFGARYYKFVFFEKTIAVSEEEYEIVSQRSSASQ
ncbi:hypothetical protein pEaSNUABM14_00229 [Erwinia phage pEa_SNUABM_14]|uniref:Uncharacterized protein n=1 Tax=Erwinia phage pEa_SNUABM_7 TaxID=2866695 RepID=A0AAE7WUK7_9CAUD|nr:hypothetical protein MPK74_gp230 [Erwinia phage pEa_SNUABM_7]QYW03190.1 hypothetical protein pEaSNUABM13_00231 [Erwinia phage pEa_SNUABM_13]QYW03531.1 hypothetical protein pEaSNUABM34_00229 [Erwinia phage pEa_SNUABM_34]QYW03873.1 hypothetical protein pEaSNUABM45_00230 [Erwinia phage pEa_SNUABM_45]QYW04214.1 hypothetical protein pEaSNUABM46_00230 [Erwinia phage pEa_SNUABM_46]QYW04554.1 hypothetical protein pEaSNUABM14_00229 [Erwinia phage pEa_SNUABM_14]QYW05243.1 hypothetical protein pEaSNU